MGFIEDLRKRGEPLKQLNSEQNSEIEKKNNTWREEKHERAKKYYFKSGFSEIVELLVQRGGYSTVKYGLEDDSSAEEVRIRLEEKIVTDPNKEPGHVGWSDNLSVETRSVEIKFDWSGRIEFLGGKGPIGPAMYFNEEIRLYPEKWEKSQKLIEGALEHVLSYPRKEFHIETKPGYLSSNHPSFGGDSHSPENI